MAEKKNIPNMGLIAEYAFKMTQTQLQSISEEVDFGWAQSARIGNYPKLQAASKGKESFTLSGILLMGNISEMETLKELGRKQEPVTLSLPSLSKSNGKAKGMPTIQVVILSLSTRKNNFVSTGEHLEQSFTMNLQRWTP
jgi:phage protein U